MRGPKTPRDRRNNPSSRVLWGFCRLQAAGAGGGFAGPWPRAWDCSQPVGPAPALQACGLESPWLHPGNSGKSLGLVTWETGTALGLSVQPLTSGKPLSSWGETPPRGVGWPPCCSGGPAPSPEPTRLPFGLLRIGAVLGNAEAAAELLRVWRGGANPGQPLNKLFLCSHV